MDLGKYWTWEIELVDWSPGKLYRHQEGGWRGEKLANQCKSVAINGPNTLFVYQFKCLANVHWIIREMFLVPLIWRSLLPREWNWRFGAPFVTSLNTCLSSFREMQQMKTTVPCSRRVFVFEFSSHHALFAHFLSAFAHFHSLNTHTFYLFYGISTEVKIHRMYLMST